MRLFLLPIIVLFSLTTMAAKPGSLENELSSLNMDENIPSETTKESLYSVKPRINELSKRVEVLASGAYSFSGNSFLNTSQLGIEAQYHLSNKFAVAAGYSYVLNDFTSAADGLLARQGLLPNVDFAKSRVEGRLQYNLLYGKFRFTQNTVIYFDQYIGFGWTVNQLQSGPSDGPVGDIGVATWISNWGSLHLGLKDYYYTEQGFTTSSKVHNINGYAQVGYLF